MEFKFWRRLPPKNTRRSKPRCLQTTFFALSLAQRGIFNFSFTRWTRLKWAGTSSPVGPFTWPASSSSAVSGELDSRSGKARAVARDSSWLWHCFSWSLQPSSLDTAIIWDWPTLHSSPKLGSRWDCVHLRVKLGRLQPGKWLLSFLDYVEPINSGENTRLLNGTVRPLDLNRFYGCRGAKTEVQPGVVRRGKAPTAQHIPPLTDTT